MKKKVLLGILLISISVVTASAQYPEATISNKIVTARVYLPDSGSGFYRATRFDWAGVIPSLTYKDHQFFGQWYNKHDPRVHDAIQGPVEAFDPLGYDAARPGENFIKIGVGALQRVNSNPYRFSTRFEIVNGGVWKIKKKKDRIEFTHQLRDTSGYAYIYKKTLRLVKRKPELLIEHSLKNTGEKSIETSTFNHNFFVIDKQPTGPDFIVSVPFEIKNRAAGKLMSFESTQLRYLKELGRQESTMEYPTGFAGDKVEDYDFSITNTKTGAGVRITADKPLSNFMYWSVPTTLSPEPFIKIKALPGETFTWNIKYEFKSRH